jgi:hypothetical protein
MLEVGTQFLISGLTFGFSGGIAPGPTMAVVIAQSVRHNWREGAKVAIAPLITDGPIIVIGLGILTVFSKIEGFLGVVSLLGACFLAYLAYESFRAKRLHVDTTATRPRSLTRGVVANVLNASPYLFWFTIGCPHAAQSLGKGIPDFQHLSDKFFYRTCWNEDSDRRDGNTLSTFSGNTRIRIHHAVPGPYAFILRSTVFARRTKGVQSSLSSHPLNV